MENAVLDYFLQKKYYPNIIKAQNENNKFVIKGENYTKMRLEQLSELGRFQYIWSAISGTDKSIKYYDKLYNEGYITFECDKFINEFRKTFNNKFKTKTIQGV